VDAESVKGYIENVHKYITFIIDCWCLIILVAMLQISYLLKSSL